MSDILASADLQTVLADVGNSTRFLALAPEDRAKVLRSITNDFVAVRGLEDADRDEALHTANRFNEITDPSRNRIRPDAAFLGEVFKGYNPKASKDARLAQITEFRAKAKRHALDTDFLNARDLWFTTDLILDTEERAVRGEDTGYFGDKIARVGEAFISPLNDWFKTIGGRNAKDVSEEARRFKVRHFAENLTFDDNENTFFVEGIRINPNEDVSFGQKLASGVGSVGSGLTVAAGSGLVGGLVSGGNPYVIGAFSIAGSASFNSSVRFQEGFTAEFQASGDVDRAITAGYAAMPAASIDTIADKFLVGKFGLGRFNRSVKAATTSQDKAKVIGEALSFRRTKDVLSGFAFEGGTEVLGDIVSAYGQIQATDRGSLMPTAVQNFETFLIGGIIGGGISGAGSLRTNRLINELNADVQQFSALVKEGKTQEAAKLVADKNLEQRAGITAPDVLQQEPATQRSDAQGKEDDQSGERTAQNEIPQQERPEEQRADQEAEQEGVSPEVDQEESGETQESPDSDQPINESTERNDPEPKAPTYTPEGNRLHIGDDGSRVADGNLVRVEGNEVVTRGARGAVKKRQKFPPDASKEAQDALVAKIANDIIKHGEPQAKKFNPDGVYQRGNKARNAEEASLAATRAELAAQPDSSSVATEADSSALQALGTLLTRARKATSKLPKPKTQAETPVAAGIRATVPGLSALARINPLAVERVAEIAENYRRARKNSADGPEFRQLSAELALELEELQELSRQAYFADQRAKLGQDFPEAFQDDTISISDLRQLINELKEAKGGETSTPDAWRPLVEQHLEFMPEATEVLPDDISPRLRSTYDEAIEHIQGIDLDSLTPAEMRNLFISLDSLVTDRSPSEIFSSYAAEAARKRVVALAEGKGLFRSAFAKVLIRSEKLGRFFQGARGFENVLKNLSPTERGRAILRHFTQPFEDAENAFLRESREFEAMFQALHDQTLGPATKANEMAPIRVGIVSYITQAFELGDVNESVRNTISKIRDSLEKQQRFANMRDDSDQARQERRIRIQAERTELELNAFLEGVELDSDTLFEDVLTRADEFLTDQEKAFLGGIRDWFATRRNDVKFLTEAVIGRPFQGITNYMPQMLLGDGNIAIDQDHPIDASNMQGLTGIPENSLLRTAEQGNLAERTQTSSVPEGMSYVFDANYVFVQAGKAMLYDLNTLPERKIINKAFSDPDNRLALMETMDGRAENVHALQTNFQLRTTDQLEAHKGVNAFTQALGWGYRRLSGRVLSALHQIFSQSISPMSHFIAQYPRFAAIVPQSMSMGFESMRNPDSAAARHIAEHVPTLRNRNFVGERAIQEEARNPVLPAGTTERVFNRVTGFLDGLNERVLFKPMQWGDMLSAEGLYFANLYRIMRTDGDVATWAEFRNRIQEATPAQIRRAKVNLEANIAPSANNQRGALAGSKHAGITALRMLLIPFTSHRLNAVNETWTSVRDMLTGGYGMTKRERFAAAQNIAAYGVQAAAFTAVKFGIGAALYLGVKSLMNFDEEDDEKLIELQLELANAKADGDKEKAAILDAELRSLQNVRKLIKNKDKKKLSGESLTHQIIKDIVGNTLYVAVPDESVNYVGYLLDQMRSEDFKRWKEDEKQLINGLIKEAEEAKDKREVARLRLQKRDVEAMELLQTGHRPFGHFDSMGTFGSVIEPLTSTVSEAVDSVFDESNEFSGNEVLQALGIFGVGQADLTGFARDLEKIQEQRSKDNHKQREKRKKELEKAAAEPDSEPIFLN